MGLLVSASAAAMAAPHPPAQDAVAQTACGIVEDAAHATGLPVDVLTRLVWTESRFQAGVVSRAGAQGIAQFMPETAAERGLVDPFDPEQAVPAAARLLADLDRQFGNIGLAVAAYNAGAARVARWLGGAGDLPRETQAYVIALTERTADEWALTRAESGRNPSAEAQTCSAVATALRAEEASGQTAVAPWGVQLAGNFSKTVALASFERAVQRYAGVLPPSRPMILGTRLLSRGTRRFYRILVPAASRIAADNVCRAIVASGGACMVLRT
jgi:hypothetical protein